MSIFDQQKRPIEFDQEPIKPFGADMDFRELKAGGGSKLFKVNAEGLFMGADNFTAAPFKASFAGAFTSTSATITGAINATSGKIGTATNYWSIGATGITAVAASTDVIINYGKTDFGQDSTAGFILGYDYSATASKFEIGSSATKIFKYDGTDLSLTGGTITGGTVQTGTSGERIVMASNTLKSYDTSGVLRAQLGPIGYRLFAADASTVGSIYGTVVGATPTCNFLIGAIGFTFDAAGIFAGVSKYSGNWVPDGAGTKNLGDATDYWGDVSYKTLTDRGCLFDADDGVELQDGRIVSDVEAIKAIQKHPTKLTIQGLPALNYKTFPKKIYRPADKDGKILPRDEDDIPYWYEDVEDKETKKIEKVKKIAADGVETTGVISILLGAIKELSNRIETLEKKLS